MIGSLHPIVDPSFMCSHWASHKSPVDVDAGFEQMTRPGWWPYEHLAPHCRIPRRTVSLLAGNLDRDVMNIDRGARGWNSQLVPVTMLN
jgi:hypothetical protein